MKLSDVNPVKCPHLYAALCRGQARQYEGWNRVVELRRAGEADAADRLVRKLLGVYTPMSEETKEKLRVYTEEHKEEIQEKRKQGRDIRRRTIALLTTGKSKAR